MNVKQKYLKDESGKIFSPISYMGATYLDDGGQIINYMAQYSELIFVGHTNDAGISSQNSFIEFKIRTADFDKYENFVQDRGYHIPESGWYSIYTRFQLERLVGATNLKRNLMLGFCINGKASDNENRRWVQQEYDRCVTCFSNTIQLQKEDVINFQYYCDGDTSKKISISEIFIIKENQYELSDEESLSEGDIKIKYIKDENNEIFSPVIDSSSLYFKNKNYNETFGNCVRLAAMTFRSEGTLSSTQSAGEDTNVNWANNFGEYINKSLLVKISDKGIPKYVVTQNGWYVVGMSARFPDAQNNVQDVLLDVLIDGVSNWVSSMRATYRMGGSGNICRYLTKGQTISFRYWRDISFSNIRSANCFIKYCGDNF